MRRSQGLRALNGVGGPCGCARERRPRPAAAIRPGLQLMGWGGVGPGGRPRFGRAGDSGAASEVGLNPRPGAFNSNDPGKTGGTRLQLAPPPLDPETGRWGRDQERPDPRSLSQLFSHTRRTLRPEPLLRPCPVSWSGSFGLSDGPWGIVCGQRNTQRHQARLLRKASELAGGSPMASLPSSPLPHPGCIYPSVLPRGQPGC